MSCGLPCSRDIPKLHMILKQFQFYWCLFPPLHLYWYDDLIELSNTTSHFIPIQCYIQSQCCAIVPTGNYCSMQKSKKWILGSSVAHTSLFGIKSREIIYFCDIWFQSPERCLKPALFIIWLIGFQIEKIELLC